MSYFELEPHRICLLIIMLFPSVPNDDDVASMGICRPGQASKAEATKYSVLNLPIHRYMYVVPGYACRYLALAVRGTIKAGLVLRGYIALWVLIVAIRGTYLHVSLHLRVT